MKGSTLLVLILVTAPALSAEAPPEPAAGEPKAPPRRRDEWQYLTRFFTVDAFDEGAPAPPPPRPGTARRVVRRTVARSGGFDGAGNTFSTRGLPSGERLAVRSARFGRVEFRRPPTDGGSSNMVPCEGQEIPISTRRIFNAVFWLGAAHHGNQDGWVEFRFEDGSTGRGPIGFSDYWNESPVHGEEPAFRLPLVGPPEQPPSGAVSVWLQYTPIPEAKRVVALRLPALPNAGIFAMTLGWREGVRPILPPVKARPEPGLVAIFGEPGFPIYGRRADVGPERIRDALVKAGISAAILDLEQLKDDAILHPKAYPVLINPYANCYPEEAFEAIRAYRQAGGAMVHFGVPFTHPVARTAYGAWFDRGHRAEAMGHDGPQALGAGGFRDAPSNAVSATPELAAWGLGDVEWDRFFARGAAAAPYASSAQPLQRSSLAPTDEVVPLLRLKGFDEDPYAALVRHKDCAFDGAIDLWLGWTCFGLPALERPATLTAETVVRGTASILHEKKLIDDDLWAGISRPVAEDLRSPGTLEPVLPGTEGTGRLPPGPPVARRVIWTRVGGLLDPDKVLLASAQGLIHRRGGELSVYLADGPDADPGLDALKAQGLVDEITLVEPAEIIAKVGHRRSVIVDPDVYGSLNLATMVAAAEDLLVAYPAHIEAYGLEAAADLRGLFRTGVEGYAFALENIAPILETRALALVQPAPSSWRVIDYVVSRKLFAFWMSTGAELLRRGASETGEDTFAARLLARAPVSMPVLTFPAAPERDPALRMLSSYGKAAVLAGGTSNLSFMAGLRAPAKGAGDAPATARLPEDVGTKEAPDRPVPPAVEIDKVHVGCLLLDASRLDLLQAAGLAAPPAGEAQAKEPTLRAGCALPAGATELFPAQAARIAARASSLGSVGLGAIDAAAYGGAFGEARDRVVQAYWDLVERSMRESGQGFLVLPGAPSEEDVAACARAVRSAATILLESAPAGGETAALVEGTPVIRSAVAGIEDLTAERLAAGPLASTRPAFTWCRVPSGASPETDPAVVLHDPVEVAGLFRIYIERMAPVKVALVAMGSEWKYDDTGTDLGTAWRERDFDDSGWSKGPAELGYGDEGEGRPEATVISGGPDPQNRRPCAYFRRAFEVADPAKLAGLRLEVLRDDGCIVWLNGHEVARSNMPEGEVSYGTFASRAIGGSEELQWQGFDVAPTALRKGANLLAVEVHQSGGNSSDLSFDLKLTGLEERSAEGGGAAPPAKEGGSPPGGAVPAAPAPKAPDSGPEAAPAPAAPGAAPEGAPAQGTTEERKL